MFDSKFDFPTIALSTFLICSRFHNSYILHAIKDSIFQVHYYLSALSVFLLFHYCVSFGKLRILFYTKLVDIQCKIHPIKTN